MFGVNRLAGDDAGETEAAIRSAAIDAVSGDVRSMQAAMDALQANIDQLNDSLRSRDDEIAALERRFAARLEQDDALSGRLGAIENALSALQGISTGARDAWLLAEAEYYLQIANAQLQLAGNPELATLALELADERILQLADPALTDVRRALAAELRALDVMEKPDTTGAALTLGSLAEVVDSLPLRREIQRSSADDEALDPELSGGSRALASLRNALGKAVSVRRVDETARPFVAPEAEYFLRANLALQLQAARLAMLRGESGPFEQSLDDATRWLNEHYDTGSTAVRGALDTIAEVRGSALAVAPPDISESLRLLRQYNALADATDRSRTETADGIAAEPEQ